MLNGLSGGQTREDKRRKLTRLIWLMYYLYKNEYRIFKPIEITTQRGLRYKGENEENEPIPVMIHIFMDMSQGKSRCNYLKQTKMSPFFFFYKNGEGQNRSCLGIWY
jgi:hypothetical protein